MMAREAVRCEGRTSNGGSGDGANDAAAARRLLCARGGGVHRRGGPAGRGRLDGLGADHLQRAGGRAGLQDLHLLPLRVLRSVRCGQVL